MTKEWVLTGLLVVAATSASGQWATEQFIPIGKSPGISGEYSRRGTIAAVDVDENRLAITTESGDVVFELSDDTVIWVDRSESGEANTVGSLQDLIVGAEVEVVSEEHERRADGPAAWVKVRQRD